MMRDVNQVQRWLLASEEEFLAECQITATRRQGPGGQHRNKVATAVVLRHLPSTIQAEASERRSQAENLRQAVGRLRRAIALACRSPLAVEGYVPSELWRRRTVQQRLQVGLAHADYAPLLAEALDCLAASGWSPSVAAACLGVSSSQLVRFVQQDPQAGPWLNRQRAAAGLKPLRP